MTIEQRPSLSIALPKSYLFTSESVTEGHPDKMCDQISDAILDAIISKEIELEREGYIAPSGQPADVSRMRCACETLATTGLVAVAGEIRTQAYVDVPAIVREVVCGIGYDRAKYGFDGTTCGVVNAIHEQSPDIAQGVDESWEAAHGGAADDPYELIGAGDQGMMFGYACNETSTLMPMPIYLAQRMSERLAAVRKDGTLDYLRPDGKTQVSVRYEDGAPKWVEKVVVSTQHAEEAPYERLRADVVEQVVRPVLAGEGVALSPDAEIHVNPTGRFVIGGPMGDCGLTGRKVIVDTYGGMGRHGGGAFSGKDCTKVDRSAAYAARWVAKNVVAAGLAARCEVQVAYAIGVARPVSLMVETFGTEKAAVGAIERAVAEVFDLRPGAIIDALDLRRPIYRKTAAYGHFGRELPEFTWERTDRAEDLRKTCMTIREYKGSFDGLKMCFIGDGNNMMHSLIVGGLKVGMEVAVACPEGYRPPQEILDFAAGYDCFTLTDDPMVAAKDADVVITDVWTSMGQEEERAAREKAFAGYCIDEKIMGVAKSDAIVQHCLPAHRGEEITEEVFEANAGPIFDEAENRLHAQKAVMVTLMKD